MSLGPREIIWIVIAILAVYVVFQLLRVTGRRRSDPAPSDPVTETAPEPAPPPVDAGAATDDALPLAQRDEVRARAEMVALGLEVQQLRRDIAQLRGEQETQRRDGQRISAELAHLQEAVGTLQAGQRISPQYGEAVMLARRGLESEAIAERCGISVAEAALVRSLSHGGEAGGGDAS